MKKLLFILLFLFMFISKTSAYVIDNIHLGEIVPNMFIEKYNDINIHNDAPYAMHRNDGGFVYCLDPFIYANHDHVYYGYDYNDEYFNLTEEQINKINIISHYGYNYKGHEELKWYGITQFLIWKTFNFTDIYFTDIRHGNRIDVYKEEVSELEKLVNEHYVLPSFSNDTYDFSTNKNYIIEDLNKVLYNFEILESDIDAEIKDNKLNINTKSDGNYKIKFIKRGNNKQLMLYKLDYAQSLIYPGKVDDIVFTLDIEVNSGSLKINKIDSENKERLEANLNGSKYGLYKDDKLVKELTTDDLGAAYIDNLELGKYYVKELEPSKGYNLDTNTYEFEITKENKNIILNLYSDVIKSNIKINKLDSENKDRVEATLKGAKYGLYKDSNLIEELITDDNGIIYLENIEYGKYYLKEIESSKGYKLDTNIYEINVLNNKEEITMNVYEDVIKGTLIINKYFGSNNNYNKEDGAIFEIYDKNNNLVERLTTKEGITNIKLDYGTYTVKQISGIDNYKLVEDFIVNITEEKEYIYDLYDEEEILVVEVPNTYKKENKYILPIVLIITGIFLIVTSLRIKYE